VARGLRVLPRNARLQRPLRLCGMPDMSRDRDVRVPKERAISSSEGAPMQPWHEEPTGVHTDAQVFRAVKALGEELQESKRQAAAAHGALKQEITQTRSDFDARLTKQDATMAGHGQMLHRMAGQLDVLVPMGGRSKSDSAEMRGIADKAIAASATKFRRDLILKLVSGAVALVTSGAFLGWWLS
jgi:hypothetical protein